MIQRPGFLLERHLRLFYIPDGTIGSFPLYLCGDDRFGKGDTLWDKTVKLLSVCTVNIRGLFLLLAVSLSLVRFVFGVFN